MYAVLGELFADDIQATIKDKVDSRKFRSASSGVIATVKACKSRKKDGVSKTRGRDSLGITTSK